MNVLEDVDNVTDCMINDESLVENDVDQNKLLLMALKTDLREAKTKINRN